MKTEIIPDKSELVEAGLEQQWPTRGYFRVDHDIFQDERLRKVSGDCFRIFLWMSSRAWRFPGSKGYLRASISMVHLSTGASLATISRALRELRTASLIQVVKVDYKLGNQWWVAPVFGSPQKEGTQSQHSKNDGLRPSRRGSRSFKMRVKNPQKEGHIMNIKEEVNKEEEAKQRESWIKFERSYPQIHDREVRLAMMISKEFGGMFKPPQSVMENLVVRKWFEEQETPRFGEGSKLPRDRQFSLDSA